MVKFAGGVLLVCQCSRQAKVIDAETEQKINSLLYESYQAFKEHERQLDISNKLNDEAVMLIWKNNLTAKYADAEYVAKVVGDIEEKKKKVE